MEIIFVFLFNLFNKISIISPLKIDLFSNLICIFFLLKKVFFSTTIATGFENFFEKLISFETSVKSFFFYQESSILFLIILIDLK